MFLNAGFICVRYFNPLSGEENAKLNIKLNCEMLAMNDIWIPTEKCCLNIKVTQLMRIALSLKASL